MKRTEAPFFTAEQIKHIRGEMLKGAPEFEVDRFLITCERTGLDPFSRQIYGHVQNKRVKQGDKTTFTKTVVIITSIDGFRAIGERSGQYRGQTPPEWFYVDENGKSDWHSVFICARDRKGNPLRVPDACRVGILREHFPAPCYGVANFDSFAKYFKEEGGDWSLETFWKKMPEHMIAKVAEAQGFRKAFPLLACGLFVEEEVRAEEDDTVKPGAEPLVGATQLPPAEIPPAPIVVSAPAAAAPVPEPQEPAKPRTRKTKAPEPAAEPEADKTPAAPESEPAPTGKGRWQDYVITHITTGDYAGRKLVDMSEAEIDKVKTGWADKYEAKIAQNPAKKHESDMIKQAYFHHHPELA